MRRPRAQRLAGLPAERRRLPPRWPNGEVHIPILAPVSRRRRLLRLLRRAARTDETDETDETARRRGFRLRMHKLTKLLLRPEIEGELELGRKWHRRRRRCRLARRCRLMVR